MWWQGRARPSLAELYNWRYKELGDLPNVIDTDEYKRANPGFSHEYQFIDVPETNGQGESEPIPYFYQVQWWQEYSIVVSTVHITGYRDFLSVMTASFTVLPP